jgi:excinuclease ABC subunit A
VVDVGPGAGEQGGRIVAAGPPAELCESRDSRTAPYLRRLLELGGAIKPPAKTSRA